MAEQLSDWWLVKVMRAYTRLMPRFYPISIRVRTGIIFLTGLSILILSTVLVTMMMSRTVTRDGVVLAKLAELRQEVELWNGSLVAGSAGVVPEIAFEQTISVVLNGGELHSLSAAQPVHVPPAHDERVVNSLGGVLSAWKVLDGRMSEVSRAINAAEREQIQAINDTLLDRLDDVISIMQMERAANEGMIRGMFASLFISTLVFLLGGLWFTEQTVVAPVEELNLVANRIASGDLETPVTLDRKAEFLSLAHNFETMRLRLAQSRAELIRWADMLEEHVVQRTQQLSALSQVVATASGSLELDEVLSTALQQSLQVMDVEIGGLWLIKESDVLRLAASEGMSNLMLKHVHLLEVGDGATGRAAYSGESIAIEDIALTPQAVGGVAIKDGIRSLVAAPIKIREEVLGVLTLMTRRQRPFEPEESALLTSIGQQIGIAMDSLRLMQETRQQAQRVAALQERERIGADLHDGLLQTLGYLYLQIDQLGAEASESGLEHMALDLSHLCNVLEAASQEGRQYIANLRETAPPPPTALYSVLHEMVSAFCDEIGRGASHVPPMQVTLDTEGDPLLLEADQHTQLVRIAREALLNASKHGQARHAKLICGNEGTFGHLRIEDDGNGFVVGQMPEDGREHFGMSIMQARAERIGGQLNIESRLGHGTRIDVTWPLLSI